MIFGKKGKKESERKMKGEVVDWIRSNTSKKDRQIGLLHSYLRNKNPYTELVRSGKRKNILSHTVSSMCLEPKYLASSL